MDQDALGTSHFRWHGLSPEHALVPTGDLHHYPLTSPEEAVPGLLFLDDRHYLIVAQKDRVPQANAIGHRLLSHRSCDGADHDTADNRRCVAASTTDRGANQPP
jgi:hypothetical protein